MTPAEAGTAVELEDPFSGDLILGDDGKPWTIYVRGEDSKTVRAVISRQHDRRTEKLWKGKKYTDSVSADNDQTEKMVAATISWSGLVMDGAPYEFSIVNARALYGNPEYSWIGEQVQKAMLDRQRFFTSASKT